MKNHLKKLTAIAIALLLTFTSYVVYQQASADTITSCFNVSGGTQGSDWTYTDSVLTIAESGIYNITQNCSHTDPSDHNYQIKVASGVTATITINGVQIKNTTGAAMDIDGSAKVTLVLVGDNSFESASSYAGIQFNDAESNGGSLEITSDSDENTLTATGGTAGAGIGGGNKSSASNITISGGTITATGGNMGAGIGAGSAGSANNITISGGTVYAYGVTHAAGIGCSAAGSASNITISNGTVYAEGGSNAAGIGASTYGSANNIEITGGTVSAYGGSQAAGIGSGVEGLASNITISGGTVYAEGGTYGAGIGASGYGSTSNIEITGGVVTAISGYNFSGAGISAGGIDDYLDTYAEYIYILGGIVSLSISSSGSSSETIGTDEVFGDVTNVVIGDSCKLTVDVTNALATYDCTVKTVESDEQEESDQAIASSTPSGLVSATVINTATN